MAGIDQVLKVLDRSVLGIHGLIVCDIVLVIGGGRADRHQPDLVKAEVVVDVGELFLHAIQIPDPVPVAVIKTPDKDLIPRAVRIV